MTLDDMYILTNLNYTPILLKQEDGMMYKFNQDNQWEPSTFWLTELHFEAYVDFKEISQEEAEQFMLKQINAVK